MQFMLLVKSDANMEAGILPSEEVLVAMTTYLKEMEDAGIVIDPGNGLHPSAKGARVRIQGQKRDVIDGPFTEAKELIAGYTIIDVPSLDEAIKWVMRWPAGDANYQDATIEIRQVYADDDLGEAFTDELRNRENAIRARAATRRAAKGGANQ